MKSHVSVNIINSIAQIEFTQEYLNDNSNPIEALYQFPTYASFAVTGMKVKVGEKEIETKIMEKEKAE
jgi:hypothetical protein